MTSPDQTPPSAREDVAVIQEDRVMQRAADIARCAFDDRPRSRVGHPSHMDWEDGYREGTEAAAKAILAARHRQLGEERGREARDEATILLAELIGQERSRTFYGIGETLFAKLATVQATLNRPATPRAASEPADRAGEVEPCTFEEAWQDLVEKDDRTSPEKYPEMALITREELADYMAGAAALASPSTPPAAEPPIIAALRLVVGNAIGDQAEARARFLEEAHELAQAAGATLAEVEWSARGVFAKPADPVALEVGQVVTALHRLAFAHGVDVAAEAERDRLHIVANADAIRERHARKERFDPAADAGDARLREALETARLLICEATEPRSRHELLRKAVDCIDAALRGHGEAGK